jgi:hypothetical protein
MNERIRELALQAKFMAEEGINRQISYNAELKAFAEKFAELIVRECVEHLESGVAVPNIEHSRTKTKCIRSIKEHFGVEE